MTKTKIIIRKEFNALVKSKGFIISTILIPVVFSSFILIPMALALFTGDGKVVVAVIDETEELVSWLQRSNDDKKVVFTPFSPSQRESAFEHIRDGKLSGVLVLSRSVPSDTLPFRATFFTKNTSDFDTDRRINTAVKTAIRRYLYSSEGLTEASIRKLETPVSVKSQKISRDGEQDDDANNGISGFVVSYVMVLLIYGTVLGYGGLVSSAVMEEKSTKVMEVLASSVSAFELMLGKIIGIGLVGLLQYCIWAIAGVVLSLSSVSMASSFQFSLPFSTVFFFIFFFLAGYLLYATIYAAIGSAFENAQDAQSLQTPVTLLIVIPILALQYVISKPDTVVSIILSMVPFFAPILMMARLSTTDVPLWQLALSIAIMTATFLLILQGAAKIYRIGILMYGKKPSLGEILKWARYS